MAAAANTDKRIPALTIIRHMHRTEGLSSFFKGWTPAFIRLGPQTIVTFIVLEQFKKYWHAIYY